MLEIMRKDDSKNKNKKDGHIKEASYFEK
jgi:hypothetical protein